MDKLFDAIRDQHPGCEVVDVRFLVNKLELNPDGHDVDALDMELAEAIQNAGEPVTEPPV